MDAFLRCALYARVSSLQQAREAAIQSQVSALLARIEQDGQRIDDELQFLDDGYSGSTLVRPALERLRDVAWAGGIERLYVHSPDRLARKYAWQAILMEEFTRHDVQVIFLNNDPQDQSPEANLLLQMQGMIAEYERAKILERTRRGRRFSARQGKVSALGHAPYGYRYITKLEGDGEARYDVVLEQAKLVQEMFAWVGLEGLSLAGVVERLADRKIPTVGGKSLWNRATVRGILLQPAYLGAAKYGKTRLLAGKSDDRPRIHRGKRRRDKVVHRTSPEEQEVIPVPALISAELFAAVAERLQENRRRAREQKKGPGYLLSGMLVCQRCGSALCGRRFKRADGTTKYSYYRCLATDKYRRGSDVICTSKGLSGDLLDQAVWRDACSLLSDPERLRHEFERRQEQPNVASPNDAQLEKSISQLKQRIARLFDAYEGGWLDKAEFEKRIRRVKDRLSSEEKMRSQQEQDERSCAALQLAIGQFEDFARQMSANLDQADFETKRKLLKILIHQIEVTDEEVRIVYKVHPHSTALDRSQNNLQDCLKSVRSTTG